MWCVLATAASLVFIGGIVWVTLHMLRVTPDKGMFKTWVSISRAYRNARDFGERFLLLVAVCLSLKKKSTVALAVAAIPTLGVIASAACGQDWLAILNAIPRIVKELRQALS